MTPQHSSADALRAYYALRESGMADLHQIKIAWRAYLDARELEMKEKEGGGGVITAPLDS